MDPVAIGHRNTYTELANISDPQLRRSRLNEILKLSNPSINCSGSSILDIIINIGYYSAIPILLSEGYYCIDRNNYPFTRSHKGISKNNRSHSILNKIVLNCSVDTSNEIISILSKTIIVKRFLNQYVQLYILMRSSDNLTNLINNNIIRLPIQSRTDCVNLEAIRMIGINNPTLNINIEYNGCWVVSITKR